MPQDVTPNTLSPTRLIPGDSAVDQPAPGIALCLSGGGYRAMLFHLGAFIRLNQLGYLAKLDRVSSVSGGSIAAGVLAMNWTKLNFQNGVAQDLDNQVIKPVRALADHTIDAIGIAEGLLLPGPVSEKIRDEYRKYLFGNKTLQDLPDNPRFVFNATNVQSMVLWRFEKAYMRDYRVGEVRNPKVELAVAVGASSAFPPVLSPAILHLDDKDFTPGSGTDLQFPPYTTEVVLADGGVYDNLGLETAWKRYQTILVSDGGGDYKAEPEPKRDWARHAYRVFNIIDNQVRSLRKRQVVNSFASKDREGTYWGIRSHVADYQIGTALPCSEDQTLLLANLPTRLKAVEDDVQQKVINWGYAVCDAAMRKHVVPESTTPQAQFPYPGGVGLSASVAASG